MSGRPGAFFQFSRYPLMPVCRNARLKDNSGLVFFPLLALITREVLSFRGKGARPSLR